MAKNLSADELATRTFLITMAGTAAYIAAVFLFVL